MRTMRYVIPPALTDCLSVFLTLNSDCHILFLKFLLQSRQLESWKSVIKAFPNELAHLIVMYVGYTTAGPDDMLKIDLPKIHQDKILIETYQTYPSLAIGASRPIRVLNLTTLKTVKQQAVGYMYMYWIDDMFDRFCYSDTPTLVVVNEASPRTLQYLLRKMCQKWKCSFLVIGLSERERSDALYYELTFVIDSMRRNNLGDTQNINDNEHLEADIHNPSQGFLSNILYKLRSSLNFSSWYELKIECAREIEMTDCPSMDVSLQLSPSNKNISVQLKEGCHMLKMDDHGRVRCLNPTIKFKSENIPNLEVFYSGSKFPRIEWANWKAREPGQIEARLLSITNTDFSLDCPQAQPCIHGPGEEPRPLMRFTSFFTIIYLTGISDTALNATFWDSAKILRWKRAYIPNVTGRGLEDAHRTLDCPKLEFLAITCLLKANDPITVAFRSPVISTFQLFCLEGSDVECLDLLQLLDHQHHSANSHLLSLTVQVATIDDAYLPLSQVLPFKESLKELLIKGFSTPWIYSYESMNNVFPKLRKLRIDISHIPLTHEPNDAGPTVSLDFSQQFPCLVSLDIRARMMHYLRFSGIDDNGINLVINTHLPLKWLFVTPSIMTRSVTLNGEKLHWRCKQFPIKPFYVRVWLLSEDRIEQAGFSEFNKYGDHLRYW